MSHVVVLTGPEVPGEAVDEMASAIEALAIGTSSANRIAESAVEIACAEPPPIERLRATAGSRLIDVNLVAAEGRRKPVLIADMDSTIIDVECIDELADFAGLKARVAAITDAAMNGELDFDAALRERVSLLKGLSEEVLDRVWEERIHLTPGARPLVRSMRGQGAVCVLVSGGFTAFTRRVARACGFSDHRANTLEIEDGKLTGNIAEPVLGRAAKLETLRQVTRSIGELDDAAMAVGDGANDIDMVREAGLGVAFHAREALVRVADAVFVHSDLTALLHLQGYTDEEVLMA